MDEQVIAAAELSDQEPEPNRGRRPVELETVVILLASIALATGGQLLLKAGMTDLGVVDSVGFGDLRDLVVGVATNWKVLLGLALFGLSALFWLVTLSRVPLSTAYPIVSLSYVLILSFSTVVLGERPAPLVWAGALLIMTGISFVGLGQR